MEKNWKMFGTSSHSVRKTKARLGSKLLRVKRNGGKQMFREIIWLERVQNETTEN